MAFDPNAAEPFMLPKLLALLLGAALMHLGLAARERRGAGASDGLAPVPLFVWTAVLLMATFHSSDFYVSLFGDRASGSGALLPMLGLAAFVLAACRARPDRDSVHTIIALSGAVCAVVALMWRESLAYPFNMDPKGAFTGRAFGTMGGPVYLGPALAVCVPSAVAFASKRRLWAWAVPAMVVLGLAASGTRAAMGAALVAAGYAAWKLNWVKMRVALLVLAPALIGVVVSRANFLKSDSGRLLVWKIALQGFWDHPWMGWGPDTFGFVMRRYIDDTFVQVVSSDLITSGHAHNFVLQTLFSCGLYGVIAILFTLPVLWLAYRASSKEDLPAWCAFIIAVLCSMTNPMPQIAWAVPLLLLASIPVEVFSEERMPLRGLGFAMALLVMCYPVYNHLKAERHAHLGIAALAEGRGLAAAWEFNRAARLNPWDTDHVARQLDSSRGMSLFMPHWQQKQTADDGLRIARRNAARHPENPRALELLAAQYSLSALFAQGRERDHFLDKAEWTMQDAQNRAPTFSPALGRANAIASARRVN